MKKLLLILLFALPTVSYADNLDAFVQGFAQALQHQIDPQAPTYQAPYNPMYDPNSYQYQYLQNQQEELSTLNQALELEKQQLQQEQNEHAWYNQ